MLWEANKLGNAYIVATRKRALDKPSHAERIQVCRSAINIARASIQHHATYVRHLRRLR